MVVLGFTQVHVIDNQILLASLVLRLHRVEVLLLLLATNYHFLLVAKLSRNRIKIEHRWINHSVWVSPAQILSFCSRFKSLRGWNTTSCNLFLCLVASNWTTIGGRGALQTIVHQLWVFHVFSLTSWLPNNRCLVVVAFSGVWTSASWRLVLIWGNFLRVDHLWPSCKTKHWFLEVSGWWRCRCGMLSTCEHALRSRNDRRRIVSGLLGSLKD